MSNTIKYSTQTENNTLKKGDFVIGVNNVDYGPTSETGYHNTITPPEGGYVVYKNRGDNQRSIYVAQNDEELVTLKDDFGATGSTANDVLVWAAQQDDVLILNNPLDNIVTDGLVLYLDAAFSCSYPKTDNTWYDLSGNDNNGTLTNGPTFDGGNEGSLVFDGTNDYVRINHNGDLNFNSSDFTTFNWCRVDGGSGNYRALFQSSVDATSTRQFGVVASTNDKWGIWMRINNVWGNRLYSNASVTIGQWVMVTVVYRNNDNLKIYLNGVEDKSVLISGNLTYTPTIMLLGARFSAEYFDGVIATGQIYDRSLSSTEILQNYNAQKSRFGL